MFLKPYRVKSNVPLNKADTRRLRTRVEQGFPDAASETLLPSKSTVSLLQLQVKVASGEFRTNVYCVDKLPMFFETEEKQLVPTLYAMWKVPQLLPYFTTSPGVLPKLSNGADLMLPDVVPVGTGMNLYGHYKRGQLVAVNLTSNKAAVGVGYLLRSSEDLYMSGGHGAAVKMLHLFGDKLWGHEAGIVQQVPNMRPSELTSDDFPALGAEGKKKDRPPVEGTSAQKTLADSVQLPSIADTNNVDLLDWDQLEISSLNDADEEGEIPEPSETTITPDEVLKAAFLAALKNHGKTLQLPLLTSNFYRLYVVPEAAQPIDLKKTKYKKLSNFLNEMMDQGFITVREETKGVDKIISVSLDHPELVNFITDFKRPSATAEADGQEQPLFHSELTELYVVTDETAAFFTKINYKRGEGIPATKIRKIIREYVNKHKFPVADPVTKSFQLDEILQQICECSQASLSKICNAVISKMEHSYQMCSVKNVSSNKPLIQMSLATRSYNKKVTLISNVECYGIILPEFIKLCKQGAAASTTIVKLRNQKRELQQIQGNQVRFLHNLLTQTYRVPGKCILGLELAKNEKKAKKKHPKKQPKKYALKMMKLILK